MAYKKGYQQSIKIKLLHFITLGLQLISFLCYMLLFILGNFHCHALSPLIQRHTRYMPSWNCSSATWHCAVTDHSSSLFSTVPSSSIEQCSSSSCVRFASGPGKGMGTRDVHLCLLSCVLAGYPPPPPWLLVVLFMLFSPNLHCPRTSPVVVPPSGGTGRHRSTRGSPQWFPCNGT